MNNNASNSGNTAAKKKRKFNFIDFLIVLLVVALIAVAIYATSPWSHIQRLWGADEVVIDYIVEIRGVDEQFISLIEGGDAAINSVTKGNMGVVTDVERDTKTTSLHYTVDENGGVHGVLHEYPDKYDITVHIEATAEYKTDVGYTVDGCRVAVGEELFFRFPRFSCSGYCVAIDTNS